jgi:hypothetical protein
VYCIIEVGDDEEVVDGVDEVDDDDSAGVGLFSNVALNPGKTDVCFD